MATPFARRMCWPFHEFTVDFGDAEIEAMVRLGFNQAALNFDSWAPAAPQLFQMVDSEVWPGMGDPEILAWSARWLPEQVERCRRYGLEPYVYLFEPTVPFEQFSVYAPQSVRESYRERIEEECLGRRYPGAPEDATEGYDFASGWNRAGRPLCISHPKVRDFYRTRTRELARTLPGLRGVIVCTGDGRMEFCDRHCPRCRAEADGPAVELHTRGLVLMLDAMHAGAADVRQGFEIVLDNHGLTDRTRRIVEAVRFPLLVQVKDGGVDTDMAPSEPGPVYRRTARYLRSLGRPWYTLAEVCSAEEYGLVFGYPDPLTVVRKVKAFAVEGASGLATYWGVSPQAQTVNDRALAAVMAAPGRSEEDILREVTTVVFGAEACEAWMRAWHCIRSATEAWMQRRGYHSLRQNFFAARFKLFAWPADFPLTSPEGVPEFDWQWDMCFRATPEVRSANLMMMPLLLDHLDAAIEAATEAVAAIPGGARPSCQHYAPHADWDSSRYGREALDALCAVREVVECEMLTYRMAAVRDLVEDRGRAAVERREGALRMLGPIFDGHRANLERMIPVLGRQLDHLRLPRRPEAASFRSAGNTEKSPDRWEFLPLLEAKLGDLDPARDRARQWVEERLRRANA